MLQQQVIDSPRRVYLWNHLGRVFDGLGQPLEAEIAWQRGIDVVRADGLQEEVDILVYGSLALFLIRNGRDAGELIAEGLALDPDHHTLVLAAARQEASNGHFEAAIGHLRALIATGEAPVDHPVLAYDTAIFGLWPQQLLGESLFELGRFDEAAAAFRAALEAGAPAREVMTKLSVCESLARRKTVSADGTRTSSGNKALGDE